MFHDSQYHAFTSYAVAVRRGIEEWENIVVEYHTVQLETNSSKSGDGHICHSGVSLLAT